MSENTAAPGTGLHQGKRRHRDGARELLKLLRTQNPEADRSALVQLYIDHIRQIDGTEDPDAIDALVIAPLREWLLANITEPRQPAQKKTREERKAEQAALVAEIATKDNQRVEEIITRRLMEWEVIDGRRLGDLTGADCRNLSERLGVFFHVISERIPARAKIRNQLTELELQALARHHNLITP